MAGSRELYPGTLRDEIDKSGHHPDTTTISRRCKAKHLPRHPIALHLREIVGICAYGWHFHPKTLITKRSKSAFARYAVGVSPSAAAAASLAALAALALAMRSAFSFSAASLAAFSSGVSSGFLIVFVLIVVAALVYSGSMVRQVLGQTRTQV